jgi:hypothetical protein
MSKVIYNDTLIAIALLEGTVDPEYPLSNVRDNHPRKPFRTTGNTCKLRIDEAGLATGLGIVNTNATSIIIESVVAIVYAWGYDESEALLVAGEDNEGNVITWLDESAQQETWVQQYDNYDGKSGILFAEFEQIMMSRTIDITLTSENDSYVSIGLINIGQTMSFRDFEHDQYQGTTEDKGQETELNDGSFYYKPLRVLRKPSGVVVMYAGSDNIDPAGYNTCKDFFEKLWLVQGKTPMVWKISEKGAVSNMYAGIDQEPVEVMRGLSHKIVSISFKERI